MTIGERIKEARKSKRLSQEDIAQRIGVTRATISKWEKGYRNIDIPLIKKIAQALEIPFATLILDDENEKCNCAEQKDPVTARGEEIMREKNQKLKEENNALRIEQNKQIEMYNRANEKCMTALEAMEAGIEKLQSSIVENDLTFEQLGDLTEKLARLGSSVSMVRMSMGLQIPPYVMGINSGFNSVSSD